MNRIILLASLYLFSYFFSISVIALEHSPKLTGTINLSVKSGTVEANFTLQNIPKINDYLIFLNAGLNVEYFRNKEDTSNYVFDKIYNTKYSYESFGYYFPDNSGQDKFLPSDIQFKYMGKFPVINNMDKASDIGDWKGNIAFNGKTIRTDGFQTAWYPVLYDIKNDKRYHELTYDIQVNCLDCKSIYVNGSTPVSGTSGAFKREKPTSLTLFAGDYDIAKENGSYYLNSGLSRVQMSELGRLTASFQEYYQEKLALPYGENVVYIHTTPISKNNAWLFVAYPSIVTINHEVGGLNNLFDENEASWFKPFIAHELAHYYFGTFREFNSALGDMFSESFSEYLALKLTKNLLGEATYLEKVNKKIAALEGENLTVIKEVVTSADYGNRNLYVYTYAPIIWLALEREIGEDKMWVWLHNMLTMETTYTDYKFMIKALGKVLNDEDKLAYLIKNYFSNKEAIKSAKILLKEEIKRS